MAIAFARFAVFAIVLVFVERAAAYTDGRCLPRDRLQGGELVEGIGLLLSIPDTNPVNPALATLAPTRNFRALAGAEVASEFLVKRLSLLA
jgi:hypothetical protein